MKGFSRANLMYMRAFAEAWPDESIVQQAVGHFRLGHNRVLSKLRERASGLTCAARATEHDWSRNVLTHQIEGRLPAAGSGLARSTLKDRCLFDFLGIGPEADERAIEAAVVRHIPRFLLELGADDFFIDLLFHHLKLRCDVVVELKAGAVKPAHTGQLGFYLTAVDAQVK